MDVMGTLEREPLDPGSEVPLYLQLKERILQVMATHALDGQTPLPTEQEISRRLGLSRGTVRRCFRDLVDEGRVVRRRGLGTFVAHPRGARGMDIAFSFTAEVTALGMRPSSEVLGRPGRRACPRAPRRHQGEPAAPPAPARRGCGPRRPPDVGPPGGRVLANVATPKATEGAFGGMGLRQRSLPNAQRDVRS